MRLRGAFWGTISSALLIGSVAAGNTGDPTTCPGYSASNIEDHGSLITADLTLDGDGCNLYDEDLANLKLLVEYQTSKSLATPSSFTLFSLLFFVILSYDRARSMLVFFCTPLPRTQRLFFILLLFSTSPLSSSYQCCAHSSQLL